MRQAKVTHLLLIPQPYLNMKKLLATFFFLLSLITIPDSVQAATYYVCPCDTGAHPSCPVGFGNDGTATPTNPNTPRNWFDGGFLSSRAAGDNILICEGGSKTGVSFLFLNENATPTAPITIGTYVASWGGAGVKPWLQMTGSITIGWGSNSFTDGGYVIRGLKLDGQGSAINCLNVYDPSWNYLLFENNEVTRCNHTSALEFSDVATYSQSVNRFVHIKGNNFHNNAGIPIHGSFWRYIFENNTFTANGADTGLDHHIYVSGISGHGIIRNNTFSASGWGTLEGSGTTCRGGNITFHGQQHNTTITNNKIVNTGGYTSTCSGITVNGGYTADRPERFTGIVISDNLFVNVGAGMLIGAAPNIKIRNNVIVNTDTCIAFPSAVVDSVDGPDTGAEIVNNSCYLGPTTVNKTGINMINGSAPLGIGSNVIVRNNLIRFGSGAAIQTCFQPHTHDLADFSAFSHNSCSTEGGGGTFRWSDTYTLLSTAQANGWNANGSDADPLLVEVPTSANNWNMRLQSGSPIRSTGVNCPSTTRTGKPKGATCSIGAYQPND